MCRRISLRGDVFIGTTTTDTSFVIRCIIGYFKQAPANWPVISSLDILDSGNPGYQVDAQINNKLFRALVDRQYRISTSYAKYGYKSFIDYKFSFPWRKIWNYKSKAQNNNSLDMFDYPVMLWLCDVTLANVATIYPTWSCKLTYKDI